MPRVTVADERVRASANDGPGVDQHLTGERRAGERRQRRAWVWRERRSGFDRRRTHRSRIAWAWDGALAHLRDNPLTFLLVLTLANLLSLLDLVLTQRALAAGAVEINPVMRSLLADNPTAAAAVKIGLVAGVSALVFALRRYRLMITVGLLTVALFAIIVAYHVLGSLFLV